MHNLNVFEYKNLPSNRIFLKEDQVHLWVFSISSFRKDINHLFQLLDSKEKKISSHYSKQIDKENYIIRHGVAKKLLQRYLLKEEINFIYNDALKPLVEGINFNIAHSGSHFVFAASSSMEIGVDIQEIYPLMFLDQMIEDYFCEEEKKHFLDTKNNESFFYIWSRKEAILKSIGKGITSELKKINTINTLNKNDWTKIKTHFVEKDIWVTSPKIKGNISLSIALS